MSTTATLYSYFTIIQKLQQKPHCTQKELVAHVAKKLDSFREITGKAEKGLAPSSFHRTIKEIRALVGIDIQCRKRDNTYFIAESDHQNRFLQQMADAFYTLQLLHLNDGLQALVQPEKGGEKDAQYFGIVLNAIKNRKQLAFTYLKHWEPDATYRTIAPYLLKEAGRRWYLIGKDTGGNQYIKHFALDRMSDVYETDTSFTPPADTAYADLYQHSFGIDGPHNDDEVVQDVVLSFDHYQGKYVKALPLHPSQEEIIADEDKDKEEPEYRIRLRLYITRDLVMKILSYGDTVKVLQPQVLAKRIREELQRTFKQYK